MIDLKRTILSKKIRDKFQIRDNTFIATPKVDPSDKIEVEIGDAKQPDFKPQAKIKRWDNEVNFSIRAEEHHQATIEIDGEKIKYITPDYEVHQYDKPEAGEDGGLEFEWVLLRKPKTNVLRATIQTKELDFFYQPELTPEEIAEGAERPEHVVGSYAVYHKSKRNNMLGGKEYKTGKAFHIYRPKATDAEGKEIWCDLHIDVENGYLSVTIPQSFLESAVYPVVVDPTFGYTSNGATAENGSGDIKGSVFQISENGTGDSISQYGRIYYTTGKKAKSKVYLGSNDSSVTNGETEELTSYSLSVGWNTFNFPSSPSLTASTNYVLVTWHQTSNNFQFYYDSGDTNQGHYQDISYGNWPSTATFSNNNNKYSIYVTYTASGGGSSSPSLSPSASVSPSPSASQSPSASPSASASPSSSASLSPSLSPSASQSPSSSESRSESLSPSASQSPSSSESLSPSSSPSDSQSPSSSVSLSPSASPSASQSPSSSGSLSPSLSPSASQSPSSSQSLSPSLSPSASQSPSSSVSSSSSPSPSASQSLSPSLSPSASESRSPSATGSPSSSPSLSQSLSPSASQSPSSSVSPSPSASPSPLPSPWELLATIYVNPIYVSGSSNITNFPALIEDGNMPSSVYQNIETDGRDLRFTSDVDGFNEIPFEIVDIDTVAETCEIWVKIPVLDYDDPTPVYIWGNNPGATAYSPSDPYGSENVWDSNFKMVQHFQGNSVDSTNNSVDGSDTDISYDNNYGRIGQGADFNGSTSKISLTSGVNTQPANFTIEAWINSDSLSTISGILSNYQESGSSRYGFRFITTGGAKLYFECDIGDSVGNANITGSTILSTNTDYHIVARYDGSTIKVYVNGVEDASASFSGTVDYTSTVARIGAENYTGSDATFRDGSLDEIRLHNTSRSVDWIVTSYNNQSDPHKFWTNASPSSSSSLSPSASQSPSSSVSLSPSSSESASNSPSPSASQSLSPSVSPSSSQSPSSSNSVSISLSPSSSQSPSSSISLSPSLSESVSESLSPSATPSESLSESLSPSSSESRSQSLSPSESSSPSLSVSLSPSTSESLSQSPSSSPSVSESPSPSLTFSESSSPSSTPSSSPSLSESQSPSASVSLSPSESISASISPSQAPGSGYYSYESLVTLPTNDDNLAIIYGEEDETNVSTDNQAYVSVSSSSNYIAHEFKKVNNTNKDSVKVLVNLKSSLAPQSTPVYLQVYNHQSEEWETIDTDSSTGANTDFDLTATLSTNVSNYYDSSYIVSFRVHQYINGVTNTLSVDYVKMCFIIVYDNKYSTQSTSYVDKYSDQSNTYVDKYSDQDTQYVDKYSVKRC